MPCTGCNLDFAYSVYSNSRSYSSSRGIVENSVGSFGYRPSLLAEMTIYGDGIGSLSGITGYPLGQLYIHAQQRFSGLCQTVTGVQVTGTLSGNPMYEADFTGNVSYIYRTGCDQRQPCRIGKLWFTFSGNPDLYIGAPSARTNVSAFINGASNGLESFIDYGILQSGSQVLPSGALSLTNHRIDCGNSYHTQINVKTLIPGYTGQITSYCNFVLLCQTCSS